MRGLLDRPGVNTPFLTTPSPAFNKFKWKFASFVRRLPSLRRYHSGPKFGTMKYSLPKTDKSQSLQMLQSYEAVVGQYQQKYGPTEPNFDAAYMNKNRYCRDPYPEQDLPLSWHIMFQDAIRQTKKRFEPFLKGAKSMSYEQVVEELDFKKSNGHPDRFYFATKGLWVKSNEIGHQFSKDTKEWKPKEVIGKYISAMSDEKTAFYIPWLDCQKIEIRLLEKLLQNKIRTFNCASIENVIAMNMLCLDLNQNFYMMGSKLNSWITVGATKFLGSWNTMIQKHLKIGECNSFSIDGGQWDARMFVMLLWAVQELRQHWSDLDKK